MTDTLPSGRLLAYYGDDYTGSAAVMEVMSFAGLPTVLFLDLPTAERLARFADHRGIGIAGIARSRTPHWMDGHLPEIFAALKDLGAPISQYKVCSTFDSAPEIGSIGRAIDLGAPVLGGAWHPLVVAAPALERYQLFGNLFAAVGGEGFRLDRHPTMAHHPVTPMAEADLRRHLARQTAKRSGLVDWVALKSGRSEAVLDRARADGTEIIAFDLLDEETLAETGRLIWSRRHEARFAIGSQGLEYALIAHWRRAGLLPEAPALPPARAVARLAGVSGSCSPVTAVQLDRAQSAGFRLIAAKTALAVDDRAWESEIDRLAAAASAALDAGYDPIVHTAKGPDDPAVAELRQAIETSGADASRINDRIGTGLGTLLDRIMTRNPIDRAVIAGGDTSGHAAQALGIYALTAAAPLAPGAPICLAHAERSGRPAFEIVFKGGQGGQPDFFRAAKTGSVTRPQS